MALWVEYLALNLSPRIHSYSDFWIFLLNGFEKFHWNFFSQSKVIIHEGINTILNQSTIQMACKTITGIFTSKTQEDIKVLGLVVERGRWSSIAFQKSHKGLLSRWLSRSERMRRMKDVMKIWKNWLLDYCLLTN